MLKGPLSKKGYDWWWHSFTGVNVRTGEQKSFFIEYFIVNPALGQEKPVFGQLGNNRPSYVMIKAGCWGKDARQLHRFYPIKDLLIQENELKLQVGDCSLSETSMRGSVYITEEQSMEHPEYMSDYGSMSWDLKVNKKVAFHVGYGASRFFRVLNAFEMYWHAQGMKTEYEGTVYLNEDEYRISYETSYGYADKNWGSDFTSPWVWLSSCNLFSKISGKKLQNSVFDIGGGRPKVFGIPMERKLLSVFYYEGKDYEFNFSKFWTKTKTKFTCKETEDKILWRVITKNRDALLDVKISCKKSEMLLINYEAPNGRKLHNRLWNGGTGIGEIKLYDISNGKKVLIDDILAKNIGCEYGEYDE